MDRIIGHMVVRNESRRFLEASLRWNSQWLDCIHVFDDRSTDNTIEVALSHTELIGIRAQEDISFAEDESAFRQLAWDNMVSVCKPDETDWILCIDADEFLVGNNSQNPREGLDSMIQSTIDSKKIAAWVKRVEIWELSSVPMVRIDGFWGKEGQVRLVKFKENGKIPDGKLGCGSVPEYAQQSFVSNLTFCTIMDFGYAIEGEAERKYEFYKSRTGNKHSSSHIDSIITTPKLVEWRGPVPKVL